MKNTPFKLKSGNTTSFKDMGSSPVKQKPGGSAGEALDHWDKYRKAKADKAVEKLMTDKNISRKAFDSKLAKITKTVDPKAAKAKGFSRAAKKALGTNLKSAGKQVTQATFKNVAKPFINTSKQLAKLGGGLAGAAGATAIAVPILLESFAKRSIKRKKEGKSGFNITKGQKKPTSKNKGFDFNK